MKDEVNMMSNTQTKKDKSNAYKPKRMAKKQLKLVKDDWEQDSKHSKLYNTDIN